MHFTLLVSMVLLAVCLGKDQINGFSETEETGFISFTKNRRQPSNIHPVPYDYLEPKSFLTNWLPFSSKCGCMDSLCQCCISYLSTVNKTVCLAFEIKEICCRESIAMNFTVLNYTKSFVLSDDITVCPTIPQVGLGVCIQPYGLNFTDGYTACFTMSMDLRGFQYGQIDLKCFSYANGSFSRGSVRSQPDENNYDYQKFWR